MPGESILIVDDVPAAQKFMRLMLTHEGYAVRTASQGEEALEMVGSYNPELVLADVHLPGMGGLELARRIKNDPRTKATKFVALTGITKPDEAAMRDAGCDGYIVRPTDAKTLASQVRRTLDRKPAPAPAPEPARDCVNQPIAPEVSSAEADELSSKFLSEGAERMQSLVDSLDAAFDPHEASKSLHSWAGTGGSLGYPQITKQARECEEMLRAVVFRRSDFRDAMNSLLWLFTELLGATSTPTPTSLPAQVVRSLRSKRIALVGFTTDRAEFLCDALEPVKALPRIYSASYGRRAEAISKCDLILVDVRHETMDSAWLNPATEIPEGTSLVLAGDSLDLANLPPDVQARYGECLVDTCRPEEVLLRLHLALLRGDRAAEAAANAAANANTAANANVAAAAAAPARAANTSAISAVIADDDKLILTVLGSTLKNYGMSCHQASNGEDALRLIREQKPRVAVLDVNMPGLDGFEVLSAIRKEDLPVVVLMLTARQREDDVLRGFQLGADDYMFKPFNPLELIARMKRLLKQ